MGSSNERDLESKIREVADDLALLWLDGVKRSADGLADAVARVAESARSEDGAAGATALAGLAVALLDAEPARSAVALAWAGSEPVLVPGLPPSASALEALLRLGWIAWSLPQRALGEVTLAPYEADEQQAGEMLRQFADRWPVARRILLRGMPRADLGLLRTHVRIEHVQARRVVTAAALRHGTPGTGPMIRLDAMTASRRALPERWPYLDGPARVRALDAPVIAPQGQLPAQDGPCGGGQFRFGTAVHHFGRAGKQYMLLACLWGAGVVEDEVIVEQIWPHEAGVPDARLRKLCHDLTETLHSWGFPLQVSRAHGGYELIRLPG